MYVAIRYAYLSWSPPTLSAQEEIEVGQQIAQVGRQEFVESFRERLHKRRSVTPPARRTGVAAWPAEVRYLVVTVFFGLLVIVPIRLGKQDLLAGYVALVVMLSIIYCGSVMIGV